MRIIILNIILIIFCSCGAKKIQTDNSNASVETNIKFTEQKIKDCFENYKSSILNDQGEKAAEFVDSRTINYYSEILEKTKYADSTEIINLNILDKLMVFTIRHQTSKEDLRKFDGKQLFVYAIKEGMVGKNSVANNEIGEIIINKNFAKGQLVASGQPAPMYFHFYNEAENWKLDLTSIFPMATVAFQEMVDNSGEDETEYLFSLLELMSGKKPTNTIWETMVK